jgi:hypothetical protein
VQAFTGNVSIDYPSKGNVAREVNLDILSGAYYQRFSFFAKLKLFQTKSSPGYNIRESNNSATELGVNYNFLTIDRNKFNLALSYYSVLNYEKSLYFVHLDEIYDKINIGISYNFDDDFFAGAFYEKFLDSYKDALAFNIEKVLVKNKYFKTSVGYGRQRDIKTTNDHVFSLRGVRYSLHNVLENYLDEKNIIFLRTHVAFLSIDAMVRVNLVDSKIYGKYWSTGLGFGYRF